ncbi:MAG: BON domain-containing protein [Bacteroidales bacterium]|nr:BON domain-containing protein [Bacteroidales bacterium]
MKKFLLCRVIWIFVVATGLSGPLTAQTTGGTAGGTTGGTAGGTTGGTAGGAGNNSNTSLATMTTAIISAPSTTQTTTSGVNASNFLGPTFANPYYQGRSGSQLTDAPGGFGVPLYNSTGTAGGARGTTTTGATGGFGGTTTAARGGTTTLGGTVGLGGTAAGGFGGNGGAGRTGGPTGFGGIGGTSGTAGRSQGTNRSSGVVIPLQRPIAYQAVLKFPAPPTPPSAVMQANLQAMLARTPFLTNAGQVRVLAEGKQVILQGTVSDSDEARLIEGMVRMTPGVSSVRNELTVR